MGYALFSRLLLSLFTAKAVCVLAYLVFVRCPVLQLMDLSVTIIFYITDSYCSSWTGHKIRRNFVNIPVPTAGVTILLCFFVTHTAARDLADSAKKK